MENFGKFITIVIGIIIPPIIMGFVTMKLWGWFVVPIFEQDPLKIIEAIGLVFLINYIKIKRDKEVDVDEFWSDVVSSLVFIILSSGVALLSGWIVQYFM